MLRVFKITAFAAILLITARTGQAFSLLGPFPSGNDAPDGYQQPVIGYNLDGDIGSPKNLGEEYRWNTPILNYAFDSDFFDYFGLQGSLEVEKAIQILNAVSNLSSYSATLEEVPLEAARVNFQARALNLVDLKSAALSLMVEELGLASPDRFTWALRDRRPLPGANCPDMSYDVIKRNFDPVTFEPSSYVNGTLYSYSIVEICTGENPLADAVEFSVDPLALGFSAVASFGQGNIQGGFWTGLTRDDIGGLRYMLRTNNINFESVSSDSVLLQTNTATVELLSTSDLGLLAAQSLTNGAAALIALFPGLEIASSTPIFTNLVTTNVTATFVNNPWDPPGTPAQLLLITNFTTNVATYFRHTFANVVTNSVYTNTPQVIQTIQVGPSPFAPPGSGILQTNISQTTVVRPQISGSYFLLTTNACVPQIISTQLTTVVATTNIFITSTNTVDGTNTTQSFQQSIVSYFTNQIFLVHPCDRLAGGTNIANLRQGMDRFTFVRQNYDSLLGRFFQPITNRYTLNTITNSMAVAQTFERVVTRPDFLFTAEEQMQPDQAWLSRTFRTEPERGNGYVVANILNPDQVDGPGTREPLIRIEFNKVGPLLINQGPDFVDEQNATTNFVWASYDGSTNAPIIYPSGTSITDLENLILVQVLPATLTNGTANVPYNASLTVSGGQPPHVISWTPGPNGSGGLTLTQTSGTTFQISGVPSASGVFDFVVNITDSAARVITRPYSITINP
jgi:hypothetical protein